MGEPIVSVAVISYNSADFIIDALESIKNQTYKNIELIISDDGSNDATVDLCKDWLSKNSERFIRTELVSVQTNTGTSSNYNRADRACKGDWIQYLDGDDMLVPDAIDNYIHFIQAHPDAACVFADMLPFGNDDSLVAKYHAYDSAFFDLSSEEQYISLVVYGCSVPAPTFFHNRIVFNDLNITHDESIPIIEDWVRFINMTKKGIKCFHLDGITVKYRVRANSVSNGNPPSQVFLRSLALTYLKYCSKYRFKHLSKRIELKNWLNSKIIITNNIVFRVALFAFTLLDNCCSKILRKQPAQTKFNLDKRNPAK